MRLQRVSQKIKIGCRKAPAGAPRGTRKAVRFERAPDRVRVKPEFGGNGADFPVLSVKEMTNPGDLLIGNHASPRKRIDPAPSASANLADNPTAADLSGCGRLMIRHEIDFGQGASRWRNQIRTGRESNGRFIRHAGFQTEPIFALAVAVVGAAFWTLLVTAVSFAALETEGFLATTGAAIALPAVAVATQINTAPQEGKWQRRWRKSSGQASGTGSARGHSF